MEANTGIRSNIRERYNNLQTQRQGNKKVGLVVAITSICNKKDALR
jgi:hypothetical protein